MQEHRISNPSTFRLIWLSVAMLLMLGQILLYTLLQLRLGRWAMMPYFVGPRLLILAAGCCLALMLFDLARKRSFKLLRDWRLWASLAVLSLVIFISLSAYSVYPSSYDDKPSKTCFRLPLDSEVAVMQGGSTLEVNYHAAYPAQRYAYDLALSRESKTHRGEGYVVWDYYIYGQPVHAPAPGLIIHTSDGDPDQSPSQEGWLPYKTVAGNYVVLQVGTREYLFLGHLRPETILVKPGECVTTGQELGRAGNSGRSGAPHLHMHLQDSAEFNGGEGIPMEFCNYLAYDLGGNPQNPHFVERGAPTGKRRKQIVRHIAE